MPNVTRDSLSEHRQSHTKANSFWLNDARGIPLCRVCPDCATVAKSTFLKDVLDNPDYDCDDVLSQDDDY